MEALRWLSVQLPDTSHPERALMTIARVSRTGLLVAAFTVAMGASAPHAAAEPTDAITVDALQTADPSSPASVACSQFAAALDGASVYYGQFADTIDGSDRPDYSDPAVSDTNSLGRKALRQAAALALTAAGTPGLPPEIATPMRAWSLDATKLLLKMGLRGGGETLNVTATELNSDASAAQMACAAAGTHA